MRDNFFGPNKSKYHYDSTNHGSRGKIRVFNCPRLDFKKFVVNRESDALILNAISKNLILLHLFDLTEFKLIFFLETSSCVKPECGRNHFCCSVKRC